MADFSVNDRRGRGKEIAKDVPLSALTASGIKVRRAVEETGHGLPFGQPLLKRGDDDAIRNLRQARLMARKGSLGNPSSMMATSRPRDPVWYWKQNNLPLNFTQSDQLSEIREFCRLLYITHPIVAACTDIYSKFPLQGMALSSKDAKLVDFYTDLFMEQMDYKSYLQKLSREYWLVGEGWSLASWNDSLGIWDGEELINPDNVEIETALFVEEPRYLMSLPESLRNILSTKSPRWEYERLVRSYPELVQYASKEDKLPVSNVLMKQMAFQADTFNPRGIPILMRGFRAILQEEMLNSALDSIADRLYTPLILTKLGASAQDMGTSVPWVPTPSDMEDFNAALDMALAADFRALTYHWAIDMQPVLGRENVPDLSNDFDRLTERLLMVWGLSQTMLTGASAGETYAADALNKDVVSQLMSHHQRDLGNHFKSRAEIVAEAQEHFDYEVRGGKRYLVTEEIWEVDPEQVDEWGEPVGRIIEVPKLLYPELTFKTLDLTDEAAERDFVEQLNESGVPVPYRMRIMSTGMNFDEMVEERKREDVALAIAEQETRKETFLGLKTRGLPMNPELQADFGPKAQQQDVQPPMFGSAQNGAIPMLGQLPLDLPGIAPTPDDIAAMQDTPGAFDAVGGNAGVDAQDAQDPEEEMPQPGDDVPAESNEEREDMPKAAALTPPLPRFGIQKAALAQHQQTMSRVASIKQAMTEAGEEIKPGDFGPTGKFANPRHMGARHALAAYIEPKYLLSALDKGDDDAIKRLEADEDVA